MEWKWVQTWLYETGTNTHPGSKVEIVKREEAEEKLDEKDRENAVLMEMLLLAEAKVQLADHLIMKGSKNEPTKEECYRRARDQIAKELKESKK
jgi:hypothetical protein